MCLLIPDEEFKIAKKDLKVYTIRKKYPTGWRSFVNESGHEIRSVFCDFTWKMGIIYTDEKESQITPVYCSNNQSRFVHGGFFHSFRFLKDARRFKVREFGIVYQATIPKGSRYKLGTITNCDLTIDGSKGYVSKQLRLDKEI